MNQHGKPLADKEFLAVGSGYRKSIDFITSYGTVTAIGVEGTGSYGAELARALRSERPHRAGGPPPEPGRPPTQREIRSPGCLRAFAVGEARICSTNAAQGVLLPGQCNPGSPRVGGDKTLLRVVEPPPAVDMTSGTWRGTSRALD
nr:hypothetical protein [Arthrobacter sp. efr-133-TYG-104]